MPPSINIPLKPTARISFTDCLMIAEKDEHIDNCSGGTFQFRFKQGLGPIAEAFTTLLYSLICCSLRQTFKRSPGLPRFSESTSQHNHADTQ